MPSHTYESARAWQNRIAAWTLPVIGTQSATGDATYMIDTVVWTDAASVGLSAETLNTMWIFQPDDATAGDRKRRIGGNSGSSLVTTTGRIYPTVSWAVAPQSGEQYEIHARDPQEGFNHLVDTLDQFQIATLMRVPQFTDSDMQTSGTSNYTLSGAGSMSKLTTGVTNDSSAQSMFFNAGTAGENMKTPLIRVTPGASYEAWTTFRVDAGGPVYFAIWDETNDTEIDNSNRVGHSLKRFCAVRREFTAPATCKEVSLRIYVTAATDDVHITGFGAPRKTSDTRFLAPATLENARYMRKLMIGNYAEQISSNVYDAASLTYQEIPQQYFHLRSNPMAANPFTIELRDGYRLPSGDLWLERTQKASEAITMAWTLAGETAPVIPAGIAPVVLWAWLKRMCEAIKVDYPTNTNVLTTLARINAPGSEYHQLMRDYAVTIETPQYPQPYPIRVLSSL